MKSIFVGTLFSGESEFDKHVNVINSQKKIKVSHHVISNMNEFEAHQKLWSDWQDVRCQFDLFVKIDADTVLKSENSLYEISKLFDNPAVSGVQIKILDYFSNSLISGINSFSPKVKFKSRASRLMPDKVDYNHGIVLKGHETKHLEPVAFHCLHPNQKQSFYYGYHRKLKGQNSLIQQVALEWFKENDSAREWALRGAYIASSLSYQKFYFKSQRANKLILKAERISSDDLFEYATSLVNKMKS
jgi:hypothetical protein